jgi:hypothetical protein
MSNAAAHGYFGQLKEVGIALRSLPQPPRTAEWDTRM